MLLRLLLTLLFFITTAYAAKVPAGAFRDGVKEYLKNGEFSAEFRQVMRSAELKYAFRSNVEKLDDDTICFLCDELLDVLLDEIRGGSVTIDELEDVVMQLCTSLFFEDEEVCHGAISSNIGIIWYIAQARPDKPASEICGIIGQSYGCAGTPDDWSVDIPEGTTELNKGVISGESTLKILHLTDFHYDPLYEGDSLGNCDLPVCCTAGTSASDASDAAGYWGDYRDCDTPMYAIQDALEHIVGQHPDIDYVYYSGDVIHHRVWNTSIDANKRDFTLMYDEMYSVFGNTPVYGALGNHEPHPLNAFAPPEIEDEDLSTQWLYDEAADVWSGWLDSDATNTVRYGGFYTVSPTPGFRIITLNSNVAYTINWWLLYDDVDPYGQLQWLADTLYEAEQNGEKVHIISHIPSSDSTMYTVWSREYRRIIERFAGTISAAFNGHTHRDQLILYHSSEDTNIPINIAWNGGSITTYSDKNPNYKIYEVDPESYEVVDYEVWTYNITSANLTPDQAPSWYKLYSFKEAYGLSGAAPEDVRELASNMAADRSVAEKYFEYSVRDADTSLQYGCDSSCLKTLLCNLLKSEYSDETQCLLMSAEW
ncbi:Calcineurin-like phosphoesterase [Popillia japonica]|uniref:Sphingomyelin phosphodiesterase n=1 Tax=Popillia japonica TaxID=7064 RepID=A0AAW1IUS3_POPJA